MQMQKLIMTTNKPKSIIILGMHRSGTSCLAGALQQAGLYLGEVSNANKYNQKGNRENNSIMSLNEEILSYSGGSWDSIPVEIEWQKSHEEQAHKIIDKYRASSQLFWGFKDPRAVITLQFWNKILPDAQLIGTFRHPMRVVNSLKNRDPDITTTQALDLWLSYNRRMLDIQADKSFPMISFDETCKDYLRTLQILIKETGLPGSTPPDFFDDKLRTQTDSIQDIELPEKVVECYEELNAYKIEKT